METGAQVFHVNGIFPQTKEVLVIGCSLLEQWSHVITAGMNFFSSFEHLLPDTANMPEG